MSGEVFPYFPSPDVPPFVTVTNQRLEIEMEIGKPVKHIEVLPVPHEEPAVAPAQEPAPEKVGA